MNSNSPAKPFNPLFVLMLGAVCVSFAPVFVKLVGNDRLGPTAIGFWRTAFGALALFAVTVVRGKSCTLTPRLFKFALLAGFIFFLDLFVWHRSIIYTGAGMATILGNTQVFMTAILSFFIFKEKLTLRFWIAALSAIVGVGLLVGMAADAVVFSERYILGIVFGLATGIVYSNYLITIRWTGYREAPSDFMVFIAWTSAFAAFFLGTSAAIEQVRFLPPDLPSWLWLISVGIVAQALGWWIITWSLAQIDASRAGLILLLQPTLAMVWGVLMFAEQFTLTQAVGAVVTLTAIYFGGLRRRKNPAPI
jgi:drug/metabolite transporter (DMT)-like permease